MKDVRKASLGHLFDSPRGLTIEQPRTVLFGSAVNHGIAHTGQLRVFVGVVLRVPQATHNTIILGGIASLPPLFTVLQDNKVVNFFGLDQIILHDNVGLDE